MFRCSRKCVHYSNRYECHNFHEQTLRTYPYFRDTCWKLTPLAIIRFAAYFILHPLHIFKYLWWGGGAIYRSTPKKIRKSASEESGQPAMDRPVNAPRPITAQANLPALDPEPVDRNNESANDLLVLELLKTEIINRERIRKLYPHQHELIRHNQNVIDELLLLLKSRNFDNQTVIRLLK